MINKNGDLILYRWDCIKGDIIINTVITSEKNIEEAAEKLKLRYPITYTYLHFNFKEKIVVKKEDKNALNKHFLKAQQGGKK